MPSFDRPDNPDISPSDWVKRFAGLIPAGGLVLDLACGHGRHTRYLREPGLRVLAVDLDVAGIEDLRGDPLVEILEADPETGPWPFDDGRFDGIVITNYLHRPHFAHLPTALAYNGLLIFEASGAGNAQYGRPRNSFFLLERGELLAAFGGTLQIVAYEHGRELHPRPAVRERLCAVKTWELQQRSREGA